MDIYATLDAGNEEGVFTGEINEQELSVFEAGMEELDQTLDVELSTSMALAKLSSETSEKTVAAVESGEPVSANKAMALLMAHAKTMGELSERKSDLVAAIEEGHFTSTTEMLVAANEEKMGLIKSLVTKAGTYIQKLINKMKKLFGKLVVGFSSIKKKASSASKNLDEKYDKTKTQAISENSLKEIMSNYSGFILSEKATPESLFLSVIGVAGLKSEDLVLFLSSNSVSKQNFFTNLINKVTNVKPDQHFQKVIDEYLTSNKATFLGDTFSKKSKVFAIGFRKTNIRVLIIDDSDKDDIKVAVKKISISIESSKFANVSELILNKDGVDALNAILDLVKEYANEAKKTFDTADKNAEKDLKRIRELTNTARNGSFSDSMKKEIAVLKVTAGMGYGIAMDKFYANKQCIELVNSIVDKVEEK